MLESEILLHCVRLIFGGLCAFAAIMLCAKRREAGVVCLLAFVLTFYARTVYQILLSLGIIANEGPSLFDIPVLTILFETIPPFFLLLALIFMIFKNK